MACDVVRAQWINYPYLTNVAMKYAANACHKLGMQYSVYNTMRELSDRCTEYLSDELPLEGILL